MFKGVQDQFNHFLAAAASAPTRLPPPPPIRGGRLLATDSNTNLPLPPHLSFSPHGSAAHHHHPHSVSRPPTDPPSTSNYPIFDPFPPPHQPQQQLPPPPTSHRHGHVHSHNQHHHHHDSILQQPLLMHLQYSGCSTGPDIKGESGEQGGGEEDQAVGSTCGFLSTRLLLDQKERSCSSSPSPSSSSMVLPEPTWDPWSNDEVISLFRIRSTMENNCFPEFTWEHVSRKLAEIGFKRSAQKCREKFVEESSKYFTAIPNPTGNTNHNNNSPTKNNYRLFSELEELYVHHAHDHDQPHPRHHLHQQQEQPALLPSFISENENEVLVTDKQNHTQLDNHDADYDHHHRDNGEGEEGQGEREEDEEQEKIGEERVEENDGSEETHHQPIPMEKIMDDEQVQKEDRAIKGKKRKRKSHTKDTNYEKKFEMFKSFCEEMVRKMMAQQEKLHNKFLEDMVKRDQEKIAREEAWKKREMERFDREMELRAQEHAIAGDRQAKIIEFLKNLASNTSINKLRSATGPGTVKAVNTSISSPTSHNIPSSNQMALCSTSHQNPSSNSAIPGSSDNVATSCSNDESHSQTSDSLDTTHINELAPSSNSSRDNTATNVDDEPLINSENPRPNKRPYNNNNIRNYDRTVANQPQDSGKRWPRDEVLTLISVRCNIDLYSNNTTKGNNNHHDQDHHQNKDGVTSSSSTGNKSPPLWEKISQKMMEMGYNRSAKRCKEKWENINKYFRKTKDTKKKRSIDSRTCPYFHHLSHLYSQGKIMTGSSTTTNVPERPAGG